jgi:CBS domain-containing protein
MNVSDIMTRDPVTTPSTAPLREAMETMDKVGCHHLPVLSPDRHLTGVITASDCQAALRVPGILPKYWQGNDLVNHLLVRDVMTPAPIVTEPTAAAAEAVRLMLTHYVSGLPVMQAETLVGIVTISDLLVACMKMHNRSLGKHAADT